MSRAVLILGLLVLFPFVVFGVEHAVYGGVELAQLGGKWGEGWSTMSKQVVDKPYFLEVSNITSSSAVITWLTEEPVGGVVEYGTTTKLGKSVREGMGFWGNRVHSVRLEGFNPGDRIYYQVVSEGGWLELRSFVTAEAGTGVPAVVYGLVPEESGKGDAIVKLRVKDGDRSSSLLSCAFGLEGLWHLNLGNLRDKRGKVFSYSDGMEVEVVVEGLGDDSKPKILHKYDVVWMGDNDLSKDSGVVAKRLASGAYIKSSVLRGIDEYAVEPAVRSKTPERKYLERLLEKTPELRQARKERLNNRRLPVRPGWSGSNQMGEASAESRRPERREVLRLRGDVLQWELLEFRRENEAASRLFPDVGRHLGIDEEVKEVRLPLIKGWNIVGLPLRPEEPVTAYSILEDIEGSHSLISWDEESQCLGGSVFKVGDQIIGKDFVLEEGKGYFLEMSGAGEIVFKGRSTLPYISKLQGDGMSLVFLAGSKDHLPGTLLNSMSLVKFDDAGQRFEKLEYGDVPVEEFSHTAIIRGAVVQTPLYDYTPPSLTITSPVDSSEIHTKEPMIEVIYGDHETGLILDSLRIELNGDDVTSRFTVDSLAAVWYMESPDTLDEGSNQIEAYIKDNAGHQSWATSTFDVVTIPPPDDQHYVNGYVYEDIDSVFFPLEGAAVAVEGIEGVIYTDSTGHYVFPTPGLGQYRLDFTKYWYTYAQRDLVIEDGHGDVFVNDVYLVARDTVVVRITEEGGTAVNSDNSVSSFFPAGALEEDIDVSSNNIVRDINLPYELPDGCVFVTCAKFWPDEVEFQDSVVVDQSNWRSFDPGIDIPLGHYNPEELIWEDEGMIEVIDGDWQQFRAWHFMSWFVGSLPVLPPPEPIEEPAVIEEQSGSPRSDYEGDFSSGSPSLGDVKLKFGGSVVKHELPSVSSMGTDRSLSLTYGSHTVKPRVVIGTAAAGVSLPDSLPQYCGTRMDIAGTRFEAIMEASRDTTIQRVRFDGRGEEGEYLGNSHYYYEDVFYNYEFAEYALTDSFGGPPGDSTGVWTDFPVGFGVTSTGDAMIDDRLESEIGAGWALGGLQRLYFRPDEDVMMTVGGGPSRFYNLEARPILDLAVCNQGTDSVSILLGDGDGGFDEHQAYQVGALPYHVTTADFNGDEVLDLAVTNFDDDSISVLLGNGDGSFGNRQDFAIGVAPIGITTGDFNEDGAIDLAIAVRDEDDISILFGDGAGGFGNLKDLNVGDEPYGVVVDDFNGDGCLDIANTNFQDWDVSVHLGDCSGKFGAATDYDVENRPRYLKSGDYNGDNVPDLAVVNCWSNTVTILIGDGMGGFSSSPEYLTGDYPLGIDTGDFNNDNIIDLAISLYNEDSVSILLGNVDGSFENHVDYSVGSDPSNVVASDFDGDDELDLLVTNSLDDNVAFLAGNGMGVFDTADFYDVVNNPHGICVGNFNGDYYTGIFEFSDDFDDNTKDYEKWDEIFTSGTWYETNQRTEFQLYESGGGERYEGTESSEFTGILSSDVGMTFTWDMTTNAGGTNAVGFVWFEITDGVNWIRVNYSRGHDRTRYEDSNDGGETTLDDSRVDGTWDNEIRLFSDRYFIRMAADSTGWIYDTIFSENPTLTVRIYVQVGGSSPSLYIRSAFDNVMVRGTETSAFQSQDGDLVDFINNPSSAGYVRIFPDSSSVVFDSDGLQVEFIDRLGNSTTYGYDSLDRLIAVTAPGSLVTSLTYGPDGLLETITDPADRTIWFDHDVDSNLTTITNPDSSVCQYDYDEEHFLTKMINPMGDSTIYTYDDWGYVTSVTGPDGSTNDFRASDSYNTLNEEIEAGRGTEDNPAIAVSSANLVNKFVNTLGDTTSALTNVYGRTTKKTDPIGRIHRREYDDNGNIRRLTRPDSTTVLYIYNDYDNLLSMTEDSIGARVSITYDPVFHLPTELEDAEDNVTVVERNSIGNPIYVINALGDTTFTYFNSQGLLTKTKNPLGDSTLYEYNTRGRLTKLTNPLGDFKQFEYDSAGNVEAVIDAEGIRTEYEYDDMNRLTLITDELGGETEYGYDEAGNIVMLISADSETTHFAYDQYNRLITVTDPLDHLERYIYNSEGLLTGHVNTNGDTINYVYDFVHRLTHKIVGSDTTFYEYDLADNPTRVEDSDSRILYGYDDGQRLISVEMGDTSNSAVVQPAIILGYTLDLNGNITRRVDTEGVSVWYDYDGLNRVEYIRTSDGDTTTYVYDEAERLDSVTRSNGTVSDYTFDAAGHLLDLTTCWI
jgi:YD repeat-containing protein